MTLASLIREDRGTTLVELLVATMAGVLVMFAIVSLVIISLRETDRVTSHVDATQRGRTTLNKVIEELHSACFAPRIAPVLEKSTGTELIFLHQIGSAVALTPTKSYVKLVGSTLSQENLPTTGGTAPNWTYGTASTEQLMTQHLPHRAQHLDLHLLLLHQRGSRANPAANPAQLRKRRQGGPGRGCVHRCSPEHAVNRSQRRRQPDEQRPAALHPRPLQHRRHQPAMRVSNPRSEGGFTMVAAVLATGTGGDPGAGRRDRGGGRREHHPE